MGKCGAAPGLGGVDHRAAPAHAQDGLAGELRGELRIAGTQYLTDVELSIVSPDPVSPDPRSGWDSPSDCVTEIYRAMVASRLEGQQ